MCAPCLARASLGYKVIVAGVPCNKRFCMLLRGRQAPSRQGIIVPALDSRRPTVSQVFRIVPGAMRSPAVAVLIGGVTLVVLAR